ncbi:ABC transporter substrate-binding protein [Nocardioides massiliensis]|uniref:Iron complex transport system substrate-binding protein n=1 Tax=Nocardioides massiliensis TaxID=1325935 RepID=A0ABT9NQF8_9ACTN|nr:ABC transporter substrate-binding protein [Nocardioides massiliensis]MDP9822668.1 iron complex transport system substrate-binding protein [Nocardioides massiliensis]
MPHRWLRRLVPVVSFALGGALLLAACGEPGQQEVAAEGNYPVTVENCGAEVTFEQAPERLVLLKSASVTYLDALGVLDRAVARAGEYPPDYYDADTLATLVDIPLLTDRTDTSGHLQISKEAVLEQEPDLVFGSVDNLERGTLEAVGIPLLEEPALCPSWAAEPTWDDIYDQMRMYGEVFDVRELAEEKAGELEAEVESITVEPREGDVTTAAVLYPTVGGGVTYAYGTHSMAHAQLESAGLENVFGDVDQRVFEIGVEELLGRDPDVLVLLHSDGDPQAVEGAVTSLPGADDLGAVREGRLITQLFNYTEPATPLTIEGLRKLVDALESMQ